MKIFRVVAAACLVLFATQANAASKLFISEFTNLATASAGAAQVAQEPAVTDQTPVDFSGGAAQSAAFSSATLFVRVMCDTRCAVKFGANPTATTSNKPLAADSPEYFGVVSGQKISVIASP